MKEKGLGSLLNQEDNRDISLSVVAAVTGIDVKKHPKKNITDISMLEVEDQKSNGSCVGQAEGKDAEFQNFVETGKVTKLSKRALYALCKAEDGIPNQEGTYPRVAAKIRVSTGVPRETVVKDDNSLPHDEYINVTVTPELKTSASEFRSKGYSFVTTLDELKTAIDVTKAFNATLFVGDWSELPVKPTYKDGSNRGTHRIWVFGYEDAKNGKVNDTKVYYLNSWGIKWARGRNSADRKLLEGGIGWFWWSEYQNYFRDGIVYLDMPNEIIDYAKQQQFIFPRQLEYGMKGTDIIELQKRLDNEIAFDGKKCYVADYYDVHFGKLTMQSVQRYQKTHGIVSSGTWQTTGYGRVGKITLAKLNENTTPKPSSLLEKWADAIQWYEGWYAGSRSYRNNNPGNIKYVGQKRAIGSDGTFCIFKTYEDGRAELIDLLIRAATGKSKYYKPEMTIIEFYNVYAPSSDNNNPNAYGTAIAKRLGVPSSTKIKDLLGSQLSLTTKISMNTITSSASKIVFILMAVAVIALTWAGKVDAKDFIVLASMAFSFYFANKGETGTDLPYAGK